MSDTAILARLEASPARRWFAVGVLSLLGLMLIVLGITVTQAALGYQLFLVAGGAFALFEAQRLWRATQETLELTADELRVQGGPVLVRVADIEAVERGVFAFKPSNGFLVRTRDKAPRVWAPGLYWRVGRRIGVGGVTAASQAKFMAEMIAGLVAGQD